ncbi:MAG: TorF family putative porin [Burkholderiales bacterium]|nr:TorF family putative porin [Burkholderiales bacterium]MDE1929116.1 TorF family putative porin [Burkholderiales bacterium]MDE2157415.1 TorF family putative porin [Burkholderiales bacterium]MDE2503079.1 TorF family putative porin [Burkholderiales bacterium]
MIRDDRASRAHRQRTMVGFAAGRPIHRPLMALLVSCALGSTSSLAQSKDEAEPAGAPAGTISPWSFDLGVYTQYAYRGITYSHERPVIQGTALYSHPSGWYGGLWVTQVSSIDIHDAHLETDPFGGFAGAAGDLNYEIGFWHWTFFGARMPVSREKYDTLDMYVGLVWKHLGVKYWKGLTDYFGVNSRSALADGGYAANGDSHSQYLEVNLTFDLQPGWVLSVHGGRLAVRNYPQLDFSDYRIALDKELGAGFTVGLSRSRTTADRALYTVQGMDSARPKWVGYLKRTF